MARSAAKAGRKKAATKRKPKRTAPKPKRTTSKRTSSSGRRARAAKPTKRESTRRGLPPIASAGPLPEAPPLFELIAGTRVLCKDLTAAQAEAVLALHRELKPHQPARIVSQGPPDFSINPLYDLVCDADTLDEGLTYPTCVQRAVEHNRDPDKTCTADCEPEDA